MPSFISIINKEIKAKGHSKDNEINQEKIREYLFDDEYQNLQKIASLPKFSLEDNPLFFYPGCGTDILFPLHYLSLFSNLTKARFLFVDLDKNFELLKTVLDEIGVTFSQNKSSITFYWNNCQVNLEFREENAFRTIQGMESFDIYFERAFRIMKSQAEDYEERVFDKLKKGGVLISDSGFYQFEMEKIIVPLELSSYNEMIIGKKPIQ